MQTNAAITLVEAISTVWAAIRTRHPDTPDVFVTVGAGVSARGVKLGHFAAGSWLHHSAAEGTEAMAELFVGGEGLASGPADLLVTLLHEAAHGIAHTRRVKDTSRQGRWHNAKFRDIAQEIGLHIARNDQIGWSVSDLGPATAEDYAAERRILSDALVAHRLLPTGTKTPGPSGPGFQPAATAAARSGSPARPSTLAPSPAACAMSHSCSTR